MVAISTLKAKIKADFPHLNLKDGARFSFKPPKTVIIGPEQPNSSLLLLHEVGHALLGHNNFDTDVERLKIERAAWDKAAELCQKYQIEYDEDFVEDQLDSYRNWLHQKSKCPKCGLTRFQTKDKKYHCPRCDL